jgi:hypothetical protein
MRLDRAGDASTLTELLARFAGPLPWFRNELTFLEDDGQDAEAERAGSVRLYPGGLSTDELVETGDGPFVVVVDGDLVTPDVVRLGTDDYVPGLVVVTGDVRAGTLWFECGARVIVEGSAVITQACFGTWGDRNALLDVRGELEAPLLALDGHTPVFAQRGIRSVICNGLGWWKTLEPDILLSREAPDLDRFFRPDVLSDPRTLDFHRAFDAARAAAPLLLPGVEQSFPQRLEARPAAGEAWNE